MNTAPVRASVEKLAALFAIAMAIYCAQHHYKIIVFPFQEEYREGAPLLNMDLVWKGGNLFNEMHKPLYAEAYGPIYYLVSYPAVALFGLSLPVLRAVSAVAIALTCVGIFALANRGSRGPYLPILAATLYYPAALFFINPIARPDSVGTLLFLAAIAAPWWASFSYRGIAASALLGTLAFLTKSYFAMAFVIVSAYLFLFISVWRSIAFIAISIAILGAVFIIVTSLLPTYFYEVILSIFYLVGPYMVQHMKRQVGDYMQLYWSLPVTLLGLSLLGVVRWFRSCSSDRPRWHLSPTTGLLPVKMDYFLFAALVSFVVCIYPLGGNNGAYLTYFFQLITPCLVVAVARMLDRVDLGGPASGTNVISDAVRISICLLLCANVVTLWRWTDTAFDWDKSADAWKKIEIFLSGYQNVLSVPALAATLMRQQKPVYDSGITEAFQLMPTEKMPTDLASRTIAWRQNIYTQITERKFDLIVSDQFGMPAFSTEQLLQEHYEKQGTSTLYMAADQQWVLQFWRPRKSPTDR